MCGRYHLADEYRPEGLRRLIEVMNRRADAGGVKTSGEVFPSDAAPVVATGRSLRPGVFGMTWGYAAQDGRRIINARSETAASKPLFRDGMAERRCAVPASCYFEWERHTREHTKYAIRPEAGDMTWMAGIYRLAPGRPEFAILTRASAPGIAFIHDRMPVLLPEALVGAWINPESDPIRILEQAVQAVRYAPAPGAREQLAMSLPGLEL